MSAFLLESLYAPTPKDLLSGIRQQRFHAYGTLSIASASFAPLTYTVPADVAIVILGMACRCVPEPAAAFNGFYLANGSFPVAWKRSQGNPIVGVTVYETQELGGGFLALPGDNLSVTTQFSGSAAANLSEAVLWGYAMPRANLSALVL